MRRLYRITLQMPAIGSKGQSAHICDLEAIPATGAHCWPSGELKMRRRVLTMRPYSPRKTGGNNGIIIIGQV